MSESNQRRAYKLTAARRGCWLVPLWPLVAGLPDALLLAPGGRLAFVEFKTSRGVVSRRQEWVHSRLKEYGFRVAVVRCGLDFTKELDRLVGKAYSPEP